MQRGLLLAAMLALAPPAWAQSEADVAQLTRIKTEIWPSFYRTQDVEGLAAFLAAPFVNIGPEGGVQTRAEALEDVRANAWMPANFQYVIERIVWLDGDHAIVVGRGESDRTDPAGAACRHRYTSSNLLRRAPEAPQGWQALSSHVSGVGCTAAQ
ncbi:MAG: DUF4440 domain-containing protein [Hyphomonadaceae bacterium]